MSNPTPKDARGIYMAGGAEALRAAIMDVEPVHSPDDSPNSTPDDSTNSTPDDSTNSTPDDSTNSTPDDSPNGTPDASLIPHDVFPVPCGGIGFTDAAKAIFPAIGEKRKMFMRDRTPHEVVAAKEGDFLQPITPERFCNLVEGFGRRIARREKGTGAMEGQVVWRSTTLPVSAAKILLQSDVASLHLPTIRQLANCPILTASGEIIGQGYHAQGGGTYVNRGEAPPSVPLSAAITALKGLLTDFDFPDPSDASRAFASLISPALKMGGWIEDDFPLDIAEADQSQSGKTYRQKIVARLYNETPSSVTAPNGGVGSVDESIATALIKGRPFIVLDNFRGKLTSTILESAIRGQGRVTCRALRVAAEVDCTPFLWQLSTNGAELTRDLANRAIITKIRKQPKGHEFQQFAEGDLEAHVVNNQSFYLGAVFSIIREWSRLGMPQTNESRHDFRGWVRPLDWIVQNICGLPPLLDGHREVQDRSANPNLQWLREIMLASRDCDLGLEITVGGLLSIIEDAGIDFPGNASSKDDPAVRVGRILGRLFRDSGTEEIAVDGYLFARREAADYTDAGRGRTIKKYTITKP